MENKNRIINNFSPHYTNDYFREPRIVWGKEEKGLEWNYSDRIWEWDWNKAKLASDKASEQFEPRTAAWVETFLSAFFDKQIEIVCIMAGHNLSNGYPYQIFGYKSN